MSPATAKLIDELLRHAKGAMASVEKWLAAERPPLPPKDTAQTFSDRYPPR